MKRLHLKLKKLASFVAVIALFATSAALGQSTVTYTVNATQLQGPQSTPITTTLEPTAQKQTISVFPNPASASITVQCPYPMHLVSIVDILGRTVKQFQTTQQQLQLNISDLLPGRYFISVAQKEAVAPVIISFVKV